MKVTTRDHFEALYSKCDRGHIVFTQRDRVSAYFDVTRLDLAVKHVEREPLDLFFKVNVMDHDKTLARSPTGVGGVKEVAAVVSLHLDVDAAKGDKYLTQDKMLEALHKMPHEPSAVVLTNHDNGGCHAYWFLAEPYYILENDLLPDGSPNPDSDRKRVGRISTRWQRELKEFCKPGALDGTANIDRVLRPINSLRESGNRVRALIWEPGRRYSLDDFTLPEIEPAFQSKPAYEGDRVIDRYLEAMGWASPEAILTRQGYSHVRDGFWIRPDSQSGAPTGEVWRHKDGRLGFTVKSGGADPLECTNKDGSTGRWYSTAELFVAFYHGNDWKKAAVSCHEYFESLEPKVDASGMDDQPLGSSGQPRAKPEPDQAKQPEPDKPKDKRPDPPTTRAAKLAVDYLQRINAGELPQLLPQRAALSGIEIGPGLVTPIGAPPGFGKTALAMQVMFDALELDPELRAVVANAETSFDVLVRRELTRRTRIKSNDIRFGRLTPHDLERINAEIGELIPRLQRVDVLNDPCNLVQLLRLKDEQPGLVIVDYLQKFSPPDKDARQGVNEVMAGLRGLAKLGWSVLCLSATKRDVNGKHDSKELNLSSFRESGEVEYNADSAYVLRDNGPVGDKPYIRHVTLGHVKNRHGEKKNHELRFHMPRMEFTELEPESPYANDFKKYNPFGQTEEAEAF